MERQRDEEELTLRRVRAFIYPQRHPRYAAFVTRFPPAPERGDVLRLLITEGWDEARALMDRYLLDRSLCPIPDLNKDETYATYTVRVQPSNTIHHAILAYHDALPHQKFRHMFVRLALVVGSELLDRDHRVAMLR